MNNEVDECIARLVTTPICPAEDISKYAKELQKNLQMNTPILNQPRRKADSLGRWLTKTELEC